MAARLNVSSFDAGLLRSSLERVDPALRAQLALGASTPADIWSRDAAWAHAAQLVDGRQPIMCGGGGCEVPYCAFQFWNVDATCNAQSMTQVMFQVDRYVTAQRWLSDVLRRAPHAISDPLPQAQPTRDAGGNQTQPAGAGAWSVDECRRVADNADAWAAWLTEVHEWIALAVWSANVRPWMAASPAGAGVFAFRGVVPSLYAVTGYDQLGYDERFFRCCARTGDGADKLPPIIAPAVPLERAHFDPILDFGDYAYIGSDDVGVVRPDLPLYVAQETHAGAHTGQNVARRNRLAAPWMQSWEPRVAAGDARTRIAHLLRQTWRDMQFYDARGGVRAGGADDCPLYHLWAAKRTAEWLAATGFGTFVANATDFWGAEYARLPPELQGVSSAQMADVARAIRQSQLDAVAAGVGAGFGAAASAAAIIPVIGQIAAAVIAVIGVIATMLIRFAQDLGLTRAENPPWLASPFIRQIPATADTSACAYDPAASGGNAELVQRAQVVSALARRNVSPQQWFGALRQLEQHQPPRRELTDDGSGIVTPLPWGPIALGVGGVATLGLLAAVLLRK